MIEGILIGAGVFLWGFITGRYWPARRKGPKPVKPLCGCGHHHSYHDPKTGECHATKSAAEVPIRDEKGRPVRDRWGDVQTTRERGPCGCRHYSGPQPLPEFFAEEITS